MQLSQALQQIRPSYIREILTESKKPGMISLAGGLPATDLLPVSAFKNALVEVMDDAALLQYGQTQGYAPLLEYMQSLIPKEHIPLITSGSQQGLDLLARALLNPGDKVVVEAPSYLGALQVFGLVQADICAVSQLSLIHI